VKVEFMSRLLIEITLFTALTLTALSVAMPAVGAAPATAAAPIETGTLLKAEQLKSEPFQDARALASLASGDKVQILQRQGGWFRVKASKSTGWVRMLSVRRGTAASASAAADAGGLLALASGRAGTGKVVATTGIRGLDEEQLKAARYSESELALSDGYVTARADAANFAAAGKLGSRAIAYLPAPSER
jgi:uncharacterized protein YgiM (DUF1202 family)